MNDTNEQTNKVDQLGDILFSNLQKLDAGEIDEKRATAIVNIANSIIGVAKTQLAAYKLTGGLTGIGTMSNSADKFPELPPSKTAGDVKKISGYELRLQAARHLGFDSVAPAISKMGKTEFLKKVDEFVNGKPKS